MVWLRKANKHTKSYVILVMLVRIIRTHTKARLFLLCWLFDRSFEGWVGRGGHVILIMLVRETTTHTNNHVILVMWVRDITETYKPLSYFSCFGWEHQTTQELII